MRRKITIVTCLLLACTLWAVCCHTWHQRRGWISRSPGPGYRAVEIVSSGTFGRRMEFCVHDWRASWRKPEAICDLYDHEGGKPAELHWSQDGSFVAVMMQASHQPQRLYGAAYDFHEHRAILPDGQRSGLTSSPEYSRMIQESFIKRGGVAKMVVMPQS